MTLLSRRRIRRPGFRRVDVARDYDAFARLVAEHDAVVHLAYVEETEAATGNFAMVKNVCRAALEAPKRPRLVLASSIHAVGGWLDWSAEPLASIARGDCAKLHSRPAPLTTEKSLRPNGVYGALKGYIELLGRHYAERGLEVVAIRFGGVRADDSFPDEAGYHAFFLGRRDCAQVVRRAVEARLREPWNVVFAVSRNEWRVHDISGAKRLLGYDPQDSAEEVMAAAGSGESRAS
ncbi:MAG: NAD-dependent epimerase/dehydratase family protein [Planctomycetota bacterium]|jgi:nucleoside-diphosphate-sugar epimerase